VLVEEGTVSKVPDGVDIEVQATLTGNLSTTVALFTVNAGLEKPRLDGEVPNNKGKKILIYGGTSSLGSLSVQYVAQAGYSVVTTTSPKHKDLVSKFGAVKVIDHTQAHDSLVKSLIAEGPYDLVVDSISLPPTIAVLGEILVAQGGGKVYAVLPAFGPETLPEGVSRIFNSWPVGLAEEQHAGLLAWAFNDYLPQSEAKEKLIPLRIENVEGGLSAANEALNRLSRGVSGTKLVLHPWE
jgi:NADPH:quinone reductase-like Zn-dependent oxidoreductase